MKNRTKQQDETVAEFFERRAGLDGMEYARTSGLEYTNATVDDLQTTLQFWDFELAHLSREGRLWDSREEAKRQSFLAWLSGLEKPNRGAKSDAHRCRGLLNVELAEEVLGLFAEDEGMDSSSIFEHTQEVLTGQAKFAKSVAGKASCALLNRLYKRLELRRSNVACGTPKQAEPKRLGSKAAAVYELLRELPAHRGMKGREILDALNERDCGRLMDASTLSGRVIPEMKDKGYPVHNTRGMGYFLRRE